VDVNTHNNSSETMARCEVQARVALVVVFGVAQVLGVVVDDAPDESEVIEYDGSAQSALYINPGVVRRYCSNNDAREDLHGDRNGAWFHAQRAGVEDEDKDECASDARCGETWVWGRRGLKFTDIAAFG
jgi:hypothetical protein